MAVIRTVALSGVAIKLLAGNWLMRVSNLLYILLGWVAIGALPVVLKHLTPSELLLLATDGVLYTIGALLFAIRRPRLAPSLFG